MKELLEAGVHFGHQTRRWNPKMKPYIFGKRNGIHIVDLQKTLQHFEEAGEFIRDLAANGRNILFVGTKRQAQEAIREEAMRCGMFYVNHRWLGGTMTNFRTIRRSIERFKEIEATLGNEEAHLTKKERIRLERQRRKMDRALGGIKDMEDLPDALFVIDTVHEHIAIREANRLNIPVVAVVDTNCDPEEVDVPIPGNDDAIRAIRLFTSRIADNVLEGLNLADERYVGEQPDQQPDATDEPTGEAAPAVEGAAATLGAAPEPVAEPAPAETPGESPAETPEGAAAETPDEAPAESAAAAEPKEQPAVEAEPAAEPVDEAVDTSSEEVPAESTAAADAAADTTAEDEPAAKPKKTRKAKTKTRESEPDAPEEEEGDQAAQA
jgi:small subunit ribosomal protein S2